MILNSELLREILYQIEIFVCMLFVNVIFVWAVCRGKSRSSLTVTMAHDILIGFLFSVMLAGGTVALYQVTGASDLTQASFYTEILLWLIPVLLNVIAQEYIFRGYAFSLLLEKYSPTAAVIVTSLIYIAMHPQHIMGGILPILNVAALGCLLAMLRYYTKGMLVPIMVHFFWNAIGGVVLGTIDLGGYPSIFTGALSVDGNVALGGGNFGFEASLITLIVTVLLIDLVSILIHDANNPEKVTFVFVRKKKVNVNKEVKIRTVITAKWKIEFSSVDTVSVQEHNAAVLAAQASIENRPTVAQIQPRDEFLKEASAENLTEIEDYGSIFDIRRETLENIFGPARDENKEIL
jgi:membrane protease YdiL (CAAX protease family)